ncbi:hypothetical protein OROGR_001082 [Orobanche gracilis]
MAIGMHPALRLRFYVHGPRSGAIRTYSSGPESSREPPSYGSDLLGGR